MKILTVLIQIITASFLLIFHGNLQAQKVLMKYGKVEPEFFEMKYYDKDTSAEALILGDYGTRQITYDNQSGFVLEYTRHFRAKIFKKSAYDLANQSLVLFHNGNGQEKITLLKGKVYNMENGKIVESDLTRDMIMDEVIDNRNTEHKFTLPNVREGSILEYTYQVRSDFFSMPDWRFQHSIPALWSECRVSYPEYFYYKQLQKGYLGLDVSEEIKRPVSLTVMDNDRSDGMVVRHSNSTYQIQYTDHVFRYVKNDVPAFRQEPYMNAVLNYLAAIEIELASYKPPMGIVQNFTQTWEKINKDLLEDEDFGLQVNRGGFLKDVAFKLKSSAGSPLEQMAAAHEFVRNTMKWDGRNRVYVTGSLRSAYDKASGSSADINLMLVSLLKEMGISADPVIISTRSNGMIHPAQIMVNQFNYVIASASVGDRTYLMDATEKTCNYNILPSRCINGQGRIISDKKPGWIDLNPAQRYEYTNIFSASIDEDGMFTGKMQRVYGNYAALDKRIEIKGKKDQEEYKLALENNYKGLTVTGFEIADLDSLSKTLKESIEVEISDKALITGNLISFTPLLFDQWVNNPFKLEDRKFPVDFTYPHMYKSVITYVIPEGYVLEEKPVDMLIALPDGKTKFIYKLVNSGNRIMISSVLDIGKSLYTYEDYNALKEFFNAMVSKQAEMVVLKKNI